jgi:putative membrane protein
MQKTHKLIIVVGGLLLSHVALAKDISKKDTEYLQKAAQGTMSEVKMGEMAQKQAADERVKQFGKRMVGDHGKDLQSIRQLAGQKHVALPDAPDKEQTRETDKLAKLSGADFDREYVKYEMKDHKDDVRESAKAMKEATDPDVKKFASAEYQTVVAHQKEIDAIHAQLGK